MGSSDKVNAGLLPEFFKRPHMLLWTMIIPQMILLLINARAFWIVKDELAAETTGNGNGHWCALFAFQAGLLLLALFAMVLSQRTEKKEVGWWRSILFLFLHIGYLWYFSVSMESLIPFGIEQWVLNGVDMVLWQFTFMMPGLFYAGLRVACFKTRLQTRHDFGLSLLTVILAPALYFVIFQMFHALLRPFRVFLPETVAVVFFIGLTVLMFIGLIRMLAIACNFLRSDNSALQVLFSVAVCLAGPLGGLLLNKTIPFPADFQCPEVYVLAVINGLIVLFSGARNAFGQKCLLFARALAYPFTFYFFLVFLPFLPLSLPAIFAAGAGFLILVPVVLCIFHTKRLFDDFKICLQTSGPLLAVLLIIMGLSVLPGYFTVEAFKDKLALKEALQYVYSSDYHKDTVFKGSVKSVERTLVNLKRFKEGIQLPYLSGFYNSIVFEGMVLPDSKLDYMYRLFTGKDLALADFKDNWRSDFSRSNRDRSWRTAPREISRDVDLASLNVTSAAQGDVVRSQLRLEMNNARGGDAAEFYREIRIPPGVLISGFKLKVGEDMVPGQIFEKRAAMWVYHMIRDFTQRDPGLLTYRTPDTVELSVYPFLSKEQRTVEIEFLFPNGLLPVIDVGDEPVSLDRTGDQTVVQAVKGGSPDGSFIVLPQTITADLPRTQREPYLHVILDYSKLLPEGPEIYLRQIDALLAQYPQVKKIKITAANFDIVDLTPDLISSQDRNAIEQAVRQGPLLRQGSLDAGRVIKQELVKYDKSLTGENWPYYPLFAVFTQNNANIFLPEKMEFFSRYLPDCNYYLLVNGSQVEKRLLWTGPTEMQEREVFVFRSGRSVAVAAADPARMQTAYFYGNGSVPDVSVYDGAAQDFIPLNDVRTIAGDTAYAKGVDLMFRNLQMLTNPAQFETALNGFVQSSRASGIMIPSTSYIVLERSSHWKTLQLKEKQRLGTSEGLEFEDDLRTPAPPLWVMLLCLMAFYGWTNRRGVGPRSI